VNAPEPAHLIGGRWEPAEAAESLRARPLTAPFEPEVPWPRAGPEEVRRALAAAGEAAGAWAGRARDERCRLLAQLAERLEAREDLPGLLARALGLEPEELAPRHAEELFRLREGLELLAEGRDAPGPGLFQAHWSDLVGGLAARAAVHLAAGSAAVVVADPALPDAGLALAAAAQEAGLPAGVLNVLFDDVGAAVRAGLADRGLAWARLRAAPDVLGRLRARVGEWPPGTRVWPLLNATRVVPRGSDPAAEAAGVVELAFGRSGTLSGQLPGQVGRVVCHQRLFSRFSEELLRSLEAAPDARCPVPAIDGDLPEHVRRAWALGLDEGATPIFGDEPLIRRTAPAGGPAAEPGRRAPRAIPPVVFTNVEPGQRLARRGRPAPIVVLVRAVSDEAARELARGLDQAAGGPWNPSSKTSESP